MKDFIRGFIKGFVGVFAVYFIYMFLINIILWFISDESQEVFQPIWNITKLM